MLFDVVVLAKTYASGTAWVPDVFSAETIKQEHHSYRPTTVKGWQDSGLIFTPASADRSAYIQTAPGEQYEHLSCEIAPSPTTLCLRVISVRVCYFVPRRGVFWLDVRSGENWSAVWLFSHLQRCSVPQVGKWPGRCQVVEQPHSSLLSVPQSICD